MARELRKLPIKKSSVPRGSALLALIMISFSCANQSWGKFWDAAANFSAIEKCRSAVAGDSIAMICVPANTTGFSRGNTAVPAGGTPVHTVAAITGFAMGKYEVQYAEWLTVRNWAVSNGYTIAGAGQPGSSGANPDTHPASSMDWRDMIVWCNAASEKSGLAPVYYTDAVFSAPLRVSGGAINTSPGAQDNPYVNWQANGYRLATGAEWEYAARYIDGSNFTRGDAPSGWQDNNPADGLIEQAEKDAVSWGSGATRPR